LLSLIAFHNCFDFLRSRNCVPSSEFFYRAGVAPCTLSRRFLEVDYQRAVPCTQWAARLLVECVMPKTELDGLPVIEVPDNEEITVAVKVDDFDEGDLNDPEQHPIAIALRRQSGVDDARVSKREVLIRRKNQWFRYGAPNQVS
jgi:hypothetical protein